MRRGLSLRPTPSLEFHARKRKSSQREQEMHKGENLGVVHCRRKVSVPRDRSPERKSEVRRSQVGLAVQRSRGPGARWGEGDKKHTERTRHIS